MPFITDYLTHSACDEAPELYHEFFAYGCLSAAVSRRCWLEWGTRVVYPGLFIVAVGEPADRKSTALIDNALANYLDPLGIVRFADTGSKENLVKAIESNTVTTNGYTYHPLLLLSDELREFLSVQEIPHMLSFLTAIYSCRDYQRAINKENGSAWIRNPCLTLMSGATTKWIAENLRQDIISGGFSRRVLWVWSERTKVIAVPRVPSHAVAAHNRAKARLALLANPPPGKLSGAWTLSPRAEAFYTQWYESQRISRDEDMGGYLGSRHELAFKLALLDAIADSDTPVVELDNFKRAVDLLTKLEAGMSRVFAGIGRNPLNRVATRVLDLLSARNGEGIGEKQLRADLYRDADGRQTDEVLNMLRNTGRLAIDDIPGGGRVFKLTTAHS